MSEYITAASHFMSAQGLPRDYKPHPQLLLWIAGDAARIRELEAEVERLREALDQVVSGWHYLPIDSSEWREFWEEVVSDAKRALEGRDDG